MIVGEKKRPGSKDPGLRVTTRSWKPLVAELESELERPLEVRLARYVPVDPAKVRRIRVRVVIALVVHRAVQEVERLEAHLEPGLVGDPDHLRDTRIDFPVDRPAELVIPEHRGATLERLADEEVRLRAAVGDGIRLQVVLAGVGV